MRDDRPEEPCDFLPWDSDFWGFPVARVRGQTLTPERLASIDNWCLSRAIACLYFLATFDDPTTVRCAEDGGFRLVDARVTATIETARHASFPRVEDPLQVVVRSAVASDADALRRMARESYRTTRFFFDPHFPRAKCGLLYEHWIAESCRGSADRVFVADLEGTPVGYVTCHLPTGEEAARIGLLNVAAQARRRGIAQALLRHSLDWFARQEVPEVTGVTQARNIAVQALNERCGFVTRSFHLWYHKWYRVPEPGVP